MQATEYPHLMGLHLLQNIYQIPWSGTHWSTMLKLQILELKATQSQFWCSVQ
jgi:hypothetical protein